MGKMLFGTGGIPRTTRVPGTAGGIRRINELGLGCMEVEFVQGVRMGEASARTVGETAKEEKIALSAHGPYYINLNAREPEKVEASRQRILQTARVTQLFGGRSAVFHAAFILNDAPEVVYQRVRKELSDIAAILRAEGNTVVLRPEVTGKASQFGTVDELIRLGSDVNGVLPCLDFSHLHARTGRYNTYDEFVSVLQQIETGLGRQALHNMHVHVSGIEYGRHGEIRHLDLQSEKSDFNYRELMRALKDTGAEGLVICESPLKMLEQNARLLQQTYQAFN
jgi:deoxyribonuclease-4